MFHIAKSFPFETIKFDMLSSKCYQVRVQVLEKKMMKKWIGYQLFAICVKDLKQEGSTNF